MNIRFESWKERLLLQQNTGFFKLRDDIAKDDFLYLVHGKSLFRRGEAEAQRDAADNAVVNICDADGIEIL